MNKNRNMEQTAKTLGDYHRTALAFLRENLNPVLAQHFNKMQGNSQLMLIESSTPAYIRNLQAFLNLMFLVERAITAYSKSNANDLNDVEELSVIANHILLTLEHFDMKASPETKNLIAILRNHDRISFEALTKTLPELTKLTKEITGASSVAIEKLGDVVSDLNVALNKSQEREPSNRQVFEGALAVSAPDLGSKLEAKDSEERYVLNPQADGEVLTSVKRIANSLDYLNEALNFKLNAEKGQFFGGLVEGLVKYKEVIGAIYSLSPAILNTSEKMRNEIHDKARKLIPVIREALLSAIKIENETGLVPGYLLDQIIPFAQRYISFANNIGMELSDDEKRLFLLERQTLRKKASEDTALQLNKTLQLQEKLDKVLSLLNARKPLFNFSPSDLAILKHAIPLLQLPEELALKFTNQIKQPIEGMSAVDNYDDIDILGYEQVLIQNQVHDQVRKQLSDIEAHKNMLKSSIGSINFGRVNELVTNKQIAELNLEEAEFFKTHLTAYVTAVGFNPENFAESVDQIQQRIEFLKEAAQQSSAINTQGITLEPISLEDLAAHSKDINSRNFKLADVAKEFRQFILGNINAFFSESVVANFNKTNKDGIFEILPDDPKHIQDMKNLLSALTVLEKTFHASETSYYSALTQASLLKDIASRFHLNYSQQMKLASIFFGKMSTQAKSLGEELSTDLKSGLNLKVNADSAVSTVANTEQDFTSFINYTLSLSEWAYTYIDFKPTQGSANVDLKPYVEQMNYIKELTEQFIKDYFKEDFATRFKPNEHGLYEKQPDDTAIVSDAKTLLNALHHMAVATDDVNNYLQRSYFDLPTAVSSISTFVTSLNELDLTSTHTQLCGLKDQLISVANTYVNTKINPLLLELMKQGDRYEQTIGLSQGVLTNRIQPIVDIYQAQHENLGVEISLVDDNAFLKSRNAQRNQFLADGEEQLSKLEARELELQKLSKQLPILTKWRNVLKGTIKTLSNLDLFESVKRQITLLGDQKTIDEFSPIVKTLIQNYEALKAGNSREVKLFNMLREQIGIRYNYLQKSLPKELQAIEDQKASIRFRIAVVRDHQKTLIENAHKADEAAIKTAEAKAKADEAQTVIDQIKLDDTQQPSLKTLELANNAKRLSLEAQELAAEADKLAGESHLGIAKRDVAEVKAEIRETERDLERKVTPPTAPEVIEHGFFAQLFISVLKFIADLLDTFVLAFKALFTFTDISSSNIESTAPKESKRKAVSDHKDAGTEPTLTIFTGDESESELDDTQSSEDEHQPKRVKPNEDLSSSYAAARKTGFHAQPKGLTDANKTESQPQDLKSDVSKNHLGK